MVKINSNHPLTVFLPCASSMVTKVLRAKINEYAFLVTNLLKAIELLQKGDFSHFDALVGDNACHIRALKICTLLKDCLASFAINLPRIEQVKGKLDHLINLNDISDYGAVDDFLEKNDLTIELSHDELFILGCYFLTAVKKVLPPEADNPLLQKETTVSSKLKDLGTFITNRFADNLVNHIRKFMASSSVYYMQQEAEFVSCKEVVSEMVSPNLTVLHNNLDCISIFWSTFIVMERALNLGLPIILDVVQKASDYDSQTITKAAILLKPSGNSYKVVDPETENPDQVGIVIRGITSQPIFKLDSKKEWIKKLVSYQPIDLFLAYSAMHRQFPDSTKDHLITQFSNPKFEEYRLKSMEWGCCLNNPSLFFISHVYCQKIGNIPNLLDPAEIFGITHRKRFSIGSIEKRTKRATVYIGDQVINF